MICLTIKGFLYLKMYQKIPEVLNRKCFFFQKVRFVFQISKSIDLKFPPITANNLFKLQAQGMDLKTFEKQVAISEKSHL